MFHGRKHDLERLGKHMTQVETTGRGVFVSLRGRRQVGKSTLLEEFTRRSAVPALFFAASKGALPEREIDEFVRLAAVAGEPFASAFDAVQPHDWAGALRLLAQGITEPAIIVLDELPWLAETDPQLEGALQTAWDRYLSTRPVLLVALGSDLSMMERLGEHGRPLYQRMREMILEPLTVADTADMLGLAPAEAFDAQLVTGGFPRILQDWRPGTDTIAFVAEQLAESTSPLVVIGERVLNAEFPATTQARGVISAVGVGETTFAAIGQRCGINAGSLTRTLNILTRDLRVVAARRPLSAKSSRHTQYLVDDPYLRFWLRFIAPRMELVMRGRGDVATREIADSWSNYRGRAVEPLIRRSIERLLPDDRFGATLHVGSYWTRTNDVEVDLVGAQGPVAPSDVTFVGSIKWRDNAPFNRADLLHLAGQRPLVPGAAGVPLVGVARTEVTGDVDIALTAADLLETWR